MTFPASLAGLLKSGFLRDSSILASGVFIAQVLALAISPLLTRLYSPTDFGVFSLVVAVGMIAAVFSTLRLESIVPAVTSARDALCLMQVMIIVSAAFAAVVIVGLALAADHLAALLSLPADAKITLWLLPVLILTYAAYSGVRAWSVRTGGFGAISRGQIARAIVAAVAWLGLGLAGVAKAPGLALTIGQVAADAAFSGMLWRSLGRRERLALLTPRIRPIRVALARNAAMIRTLVSSQAIAAIYSRMPILVIAAAYGPAQAGYYALAERIVAAPAALVANAIGDVYRQRAAAAHRAGQPFDGLMRKVLAFTLALSVLPFTAAILLAPDHLGFIFGAQWQPAGYTVAVLLVGALIAFNATPVDKAAIIAGASGYIMSWHVLRLVTELLAATAALIGLIGYETYLIAIVAGRAALYLWDVWVEHRLAKGKPAFY